MLPLLALAVTATTARQVYRVTEPYEKTAEYFAEQKAEREEELRIREEILQRWSEERDFRVVIRSGLRLAWKHSADQTATELSFGFVQRMASNLVMQANLAFATGVAAAKIDRDLSNSLAPLFDVSADVTLRIGARRFFWGIGPVARVYRVFSDGRTFVPGGGAVLEFGALLGPSREMELALRLQTGGVHRASGSDYWLVESVAAAYHF